MKQTFPQDSGLISHIQRFSLDDGPGIRTTVFFKGCNLRCLWCHNPEGISGNVSLLYIKDRCAKCGKCEAVCPAGVHSLANGHRLKRKNCTGCLACVKACPATALEVCGSWYAPEELLNTLRKDMPYYRTSRGGVTFSGGEPLLQNGFLLRMLKLCRAENMHTAVDTAGDVPFAVFEKIMPATDLFLYDIKLLDNEKHLAFTGVENRRILNNLCLLAQTEARFHIRVPVIMEANGTRSELSAIADFVAGLPREPEKIKLLAYHNYGLGKYAALGMASKLKDYLPPSTGFMNEALHIFLEKGLNAYC